MWCCHNCQQWIVLHLRQSQSIHVTCGLQRLVSLASVCDKFALLSRDSIIGVREIRLLPEQKALIDSGELVAGLQSTYCAVLLCQVRGFHTGICLVFRQRGVSAA